MQVIHETSSRSITLPECDLEIKISYAGNSSATRGIKLDRLMPIIAKALAKVKVTDVVPPVVLPVTDEMREAAKKAEAIAIDHRNQHLGGVRFWHGIADQIMAGDESALRTLEARLAEDDQAAKRKAAAAKGALAAVAARKKRAAKR